MPTGTLEAREVMPSRDSQNQVRDPQQEGRIRLRAHEIWQQRGGQAGSDVTDWLQAEAEISGTTEN